MPASDLRAPERRAPGRHRPRAVRLLVAIAALAGTPPAAADPDPRDTQPTAVSPVPVYDVFVTGERDVVSAVTTQRGITREDMRQEDARTLDEALVRQSSIVVRTGGEGSPRIDLRGLRTRQVLTLIDGVPFYSTDDGAFDPSLVPTQIIDRIDVTYSSSSVLYGDGPIAGIVQIRTRSGEEGVGGEALGDFRSGDQHLGEASVSGGGDGLEGFLAGRYSDADGWPLPDAFDPTTLEDGGRRDNSDREQANLFGKAGWVVSDRARVDALVDYRRAEYGVPWRVRQQDDFVGRARFERVDEVEGFTTQLSGQLAPHDRVDLRSWAFVTRQVEDRTGYDDADLDSLLARDSFDLRGTALITGGAVHGRLDAGRLGSVRLAANGRYEQFDALGEIRDVPLGGGMFGLRGVDERNGLGAWSLGAEYEVKPAEWAGLVLGYGHAFLQGDQDVEDDGSLFLAGAYVDLPTQTRLRASASHKLRFPSLRQLYAVDGGNTSLDSERCWCFEVGVTQELPCDTTLGVTGFWLELRDFIERDDVSDLFENFQELESRGVEVELASNPWEPLVLRAAYTFLDARDETPGSPLDRLDNRPRHKLDAEVRYTFPTQTRLRLAAQFVTDNVIYTRAAPIESARLDDYVRFDARIEQILWEDRVSLYFGAENFTDAQSEINVYFPQSGRVVYGGVALRL